MESVAGTSGEPGRDRAYRAIDAGLRTEFDQRLAGETRRSFEAGREQGRMEGGQTEREGQAAAHATAEQRRLAEVGVRREHQPVHAVEPLLSGFAEAPGLDVACDKQCRIGDPGQSAGPFNGLDIHAESPLAAPGENVGRSKTEPV